DVASQFGADKYVWQPHSSDDDKVHSVTLRNSATYEMLGCLVYHEDTRVYQYFPKIGDFNECSVDKSGRWLMSLEDIDYKYDLEVRIFDLATGVWGNEIVCFRLDGSLNVLVVAPVMTDLNAPGGGSDAYYKEPKGNLDVTGQYFIWTSNTGGSRLDAFVVKVPSQLLMGGTTDTTPPSVSVSAPASASTVTGTIAVAATASDDVGVAGVQFKLDGASLGAEDTAAPYSLSWNTTTATNGSHTLAATARDAAGNATTSSSVTVTVSNAPPPDTTPPTVGISAPGNGATVSGTTTVSATASDNVGVAGVQFKLDGASLGAEDTAAPYSLSWNTTTATNG